MLIYWGNYFTLKFQIISLLCLRNDVFQPFENSWIYYSTFLSSGYNSSTWLNIFLEYFVIIWTIWKDRSIMSSWTSHTKFYYPLIKNCKKSIDINSSFCLQHCRDYGRTIIAYLYDILVNSLACNMYFQTPQQQSFTYNLLKKLLFITHKGFNIVMWLRY